MIVNIFMNCRRKDEIIFALAGLCAVFAGVLNGFLGTGGGIVMYFILKKLYKDDAKKAFASVMAAVLPMAALSAFSYWRASPGLFIKAAPYLLPAAAGGICGAALFGRLKTRFLKILFSVMLIISGALAVFL